MTLPTFQNQPVSQSPSASFSTPISSVFVSNSNTIQFVLKSLIQITHSSQRLEGLLSGIIDVLSKKCSLSGVAIKLFSPSQDSFFESLSQTDYSSFSEAEETLYLPLREKVTEELKDALNQGKIGVTWSDAIALMILPLWTPESYLGQLYLYHPLSHQEWREEEIQWGEIIANQCAIAIYCRWLQAQNYYLQQEQKIAQHSQYISHELRTPVGAMVSFARMLLKEIYGPLNPKQKDYVSRLIQAGEYLLTLVNDLLDISKLNAQKEELICSEIHLKTLCQNAIMVVEEEAKQKQLDLIIDIQTNLKTIMGDERRLTQILINLLANGIKFTEQGSIKLQISRQSNSLSFSVIDTGIGISQREQNKLFQPFQQLSPAKHNKMQGTGLGLALSQQLAHLHGGEITCQSQENQGSCFTLCLPLPSSL